MGFLRPGGDKGGVGWPTFLLLIWVILVAVLFLWRRPEKTVNDVATDFCSAAGYGRYPSMRNQVDRRWISIERRPPGQALAIDVVTDRRTEFRITVDDLIKLGKNCPADVRPQEGGLLLERLCSVYFVVSPDWEIRAIMDEATWKSRGKEILSEIRGELTSGEARADEVAQRPNRREAPTPTPEPR